MWSVVQFFVWTELVQHQQMIFCPTIHQNQCTHLGVFAVAAGQALGRGGIGLK